ncbi:MAG: hypothetical protein VB071_00480 [Lawsonibacter sp.]|nr:hypothetical protein [Lawsonibacter sp.]
MLKNVKKTLAIASVTAFALSLAPTAFAAGPTKEGRGNSGNAQMSQVQSMRANDQMAEGNQKSCVGGNQTRNQMQKQMREINQMMQREREGGPHTGMNLCGVSAAIAGLSEEDTETLSTYIDAYETAVAAEQAARASAEESTDLSSYREAVQTALQALLDAAEGAGIDLELTACNQVSWMNGKGHGMNPGAVASSIAKLGKEDTETLSTYVDAYKTAVAAEQAARASAEEGTDLSSYREAVHTALQALLDAAADAGVGLIPVPTVK